MKKILFFLLFVCYCSAGVSLAQEQGMSYGELLRLYFTVVGQQVPSSSQKPLLKYSNLTPSSPLYPLLQNAVANGAFPNLSTALPLEKPALESDLALLLKYNFKKEIVFQAGKPLTFDVLKQQLQEALQTPSLSKEEKAEPTPTISDQQKQTIAKEVLSLLRKNFSQKEKIAEHDAPSYDQLPTYVDKLGEPYTKYYTPRNGKLFTDALQGGFVGIGLYLEQKGRELPVVVKLVEKSPAQKAGIKVGDVLLAADGKPYEAYHDFDAFILALQGKVGTSVSIMVKRDQSQLTYDLTREKIELPLLKSRKKGNACYLQISSFDKWIQKKFLREKEEFWSCSVLYFDLRGNPWGIVDEVVAILENFIAKDQPIISILSSEGKEVYPSKVASTAPRAPMVMIMDEKTASAAEIFAGVLKHYYPDKVSLVGTTSYGKGSVQEVVQFQDNSVLKYTVALRYVADQADSLNGKGLKPDLILRDDPKTPQDEVLTALGID